MIFLNDQAPMCAILILLKSSGSFVSAFIKNFDEQYYKLCVIFASGRQRV